MKILRLAALALLIPAAGCPTEETDLPEIPSISGNYNMALTLLDNACFEFDYDDLMAWTLESEAARSMSIAMSQDGSSLTGVVGPDVGCVLTGTVGTGGTWNLSGPCDDAFMERSIRISATSTPYGQGLDLAGTLTFGVDGEPGIEGSADGDIDCEVEHRIQGTGTPD